MAAIDDRKRASRFQAGLPCVVLGDDGRCFGCEAFNLSRTGTLLIGELPVPTPERLQVTIRSSSGDLALSCEVDVKRVFINDEHGPQQLGVEFDDLDPEQSGILESLVARVVEGVAPAAIEGLPADATPQQIRVALDKVPLPHRMALAQRGEAPERELMIQDSNTRVLDALSRNPKLNAAEVRTLLRNPHLLPRTVEGLSRDPRWSHNESMALLIAAHRNTPFAVAKRISDHLNPNGRRKLLQMPGLNAGLRTQLMREFKGR